MEKLLKVNEVAAMFAVEPATVRAWLNSGLLKGVKIGAGYYWRIPESSVTKLANKKYGEDNDET